MKRVITKVALMVIAGQLLPSVLFGQGLSGEIASFQSVLEGLYDEMIPLCSKLIGVGRGLAGFGALRYIASRVWRHIASAEPVDFYPLLRPFALRMVVMMFPSVLALLNSVLKRAVTGTAAMVDGSNDAIAYLLKQKEEAIPPAWQMYVGFDGGGDRDKWYRYQQAAFAVSISNSELSFALLIAIPLNNTKLPNKILNRFFIIREF
jgi:conjugative transposon TraJ protein